MYSPCNAIAIRKISASDTQELHNLSSDKVGVFIVERVSRIFHKDRHAGRVGHILRHCLRGTANLGPEKIIFQPAR